MEKEIEKYLGGIEQFVSIDEDVIFKDFDYNLHNSYFSRWRFTILKRDLDNSMTFYEVCDTHDIDIAIQICKALSASEPGRKFYIFDVDLYEKTNDIVHSLMVIII